jgi:hypothetical protein
MPYKTGYWGPQAKERSKQRRAYFKEYYRSKGHPPKVFRLGQFGELLAQRKLRGSTLTNQTGYDLIWNGQRIEVKTSAKAIQGRHLFDIRIQKETGKNDFYFILILDEQTKDLRHAYLIPNKAISTKVTLAITPGKSRYESYRLNLKSTR